MNSFVEKVKNALCENDMVVPGDRILVAVSGGPDSVALLHALFELRSESDIDLAVCHLNHGSRGLESDHDANFVQNLAEGLHLQFFMETRNIPGEVQSGGGSFQQTARLIRQDFFERTLATTGFHKIALGHTADDQVETFLINLLRGSGLKGLGGMLPVRKPYIRPLFYHSREEVLEFLNRQKISFCRDSSNEKTDYLRNRVRLELMPYLRDKFNPRIMESLFETSQLLRAENEWLLRIENDVFQQILLDLREGESVQLDIPALMKLPAALKRRVVRRAIRIVKGDLRGISSLHIQETLRLFAKNESGKRVDLPGRLEAGCQGGRGELNRIPQGKSSILKKDEKDRSLWRGCLNIPGETVVEPAQLTLQTEILENPEAEFSREKAHQALLDYDKTGSEIMIRFCRPGDRFQPLGMTGTKKLKSFFIDEKVPLQRRSQIPILTTLDNDIIWVYGMRISEAYRITPKTKRVLLIKGFPQK